LKIQEWLPVGKQGILPLIETRNSTRLEVTRSRVELTSVRYEAPVRNQNVSIWQSAKHDNIRDWTTASNQPRSQQAPDGMLLQKRAPARSPIHGTAPERVTSAPPSMLDRIRGVIARYSSLDLIGWAQCLVQYIRYSLEARFPQYNDWKRQQPSDLSYGLIKERLPSTCKVLVIGDWGTHMTDNVALLRQALKKFKPDAIVHLGDIYYSGTHQECTENVIDVMDQLIEELAIERPPFFTLPGNHDYYSGGRGYYKMINRLNASLPGHEQKASYFCLRTEDDHWQFLGMDTGYNDRNPVVQKSPGLLPQEIIWHQHKLENFKGTTVLLSHHQLCSAKEVLNKNGAFPCLNDELNRVFRPYYDRVAAWLWGHEHCLIIFQDNLSFTGTTPLRKGRLIGCSAYEETVQEDPYGVNDACKPAVFADTRLGLSKYRSSLQEFYDHAFALLDVTPQQITVRYYSYPSWDQDFQMAADPAIGIALYTEDLPLIRAP
jgi:predicted phosphodiesterase